MKNTRHSYINLTKILGKINKPADNQQKKINGCIFHSFLRQNKQIASTTRSTSSA
jgi:3-deoxy-D-arabino-heptulosonate 7-phosphate (DAHP) synthase